MSISATHSFKNALNYPELRLVGLLEVPEVSRIEFVLHEELLHQLYFLRFLDDFQFFFGPLLFILELLEILVNAVSPILLLHYELRMTLLFRRLNLLATAFSMRFVLSF